MNRVSKAELFDMINKAVKDHYETMERENRHDRTERRLFATMGTFFVLSWLAAGATVTVAVLSWLGWVEYWDWALIGVYVTLVLGLMSWVWYRVYSGH